MELKEGDIVFHRIDVLGDIALIVLENQSSGNVVSCRYYNKVEGRFRIEEFDIYELEKRNR